MAGRRELLAGSYLINLTIVLKKEQGRNRWATAIAHRLPAHRYLTTVLTGYSRYFTYDQDIYE